MWIFDCGMWISNFRLPTSLFSLKSLISVQDSSQRQAQPCLKRHAWLRHAPFAQFIMIFTKKGKNSVTFAKREAMQSKQYIQQLIGQGEGLHLDFKFEVSDAAKIARSLSAFANTDGGKLLIGVLDNGKISGIRSEEEFFMIENATTLHCRPAVQFSSKEWTIKGKKVLEISIPKSKTPPHKAPDKNGKQKAFIRIADENILACSVQIKVWKKRNSAIGICFSNTLLEKKLLNLLQKEKGVTTPYLYRAMKISKHTLEKMLADFILLDLAHLEATPKGCLFFLNDLPKL